MGIFDTHPAVLADLELFACEVRFRDKIMGGTPRDPRMIEGWLQRAAIGNTVEERRKALLRVAMELGLPVDENMTSEDFATITAKLADTSHTQGFKRDHRGLYAESRTVKAGLKEAIAIRFPYIVEKFGPTKKAGKSYLAEHVFIWPSRLHLGIDAPDGVELAIGHVNGPQGPRSTLGYHEFAQRRTLTFHVMLQDARFSEDQWARIWSTFERQGLGARRSAGHGTFEVMRWDALGQPTADLVKRIYEEDAQQLLDEPLEQMEDPHAFVAERVLVPLS